MLKSCQYCGKIHDTKNRCAKKEAAEAERWRQRKNTKAAGLRRTAAWTNMSRSIRERDNYMCLCCKANLPGTIRIYNTKDLSVHHIVPLEEDYDMGLERTNLITVCGVHHEMCEAGTIGRDTQRSLVDESMRFVGEEGDAPLVL